MCSRAVWVATISTNDDIVHRYQSVDDWECSFRAPYLRPLIHADRVVCWEE